MNPRTAALEAFFFGRAGQPNAGLRSDLPLCVFSPCHDVNVHATLAGRHVHDFKERT
ncbi:hypothetical protein [Variovorax ginsengisoli]|uniref:Uncharacterized protein n=1 Tax=Variovorax ginsengisoli TaxID=363844 RepID=A0ABT8RZ37_9BURK|nr:hypothetical protein [Variovorax ginsengisoli]MDN8612761.1 hypothetical protein [Variovorax ginsengisoli]MDO1531931.1 hypothetical protein [Variovorax ginsengisoli]